MTIFFQHYRKYDRQGEKSFQGGVTLAYRQEGDEIVVALAQCGRRDGFNRRLGRTIAEGRLRAGSRNHVFRIPAEADKKLRHQIYDSQVVANHVRQALR